MTPPRNDTIWSISTVSYVYRESVGFVTINPLMGVLFFWKFRTFIAMIMAFFLLFPLNLFAAVFPYKDPFMSELWYWNAIRAPFSQQEGKETIVAILDAGFDLNHEDLMNQYWKNSTEIADDQKDNDRNGYEDDVHGWDFVDNDPDPSPDLSNPSLDTIISHGTLLAGMIAAEANNGRGIAGIAPKTKIMPLRILDLNGKGNSIDERDAIEYAVHNGADVINLSLTSTKADPLLQKVIEWAVDQGVVVVAAVGNESLDTDKTPTYPACFDTRIGRNLVIGVAASDENKKKAEFSNDGTNCVDISAPGVNIFGLVYHDPSQLFFSTAYGSPFEGTSMAAPLVTAAVARLRSAYPTLTPNQIRLVLMLSADPSNEITLAAKQRLGAGILNVDRALSVGAEFANVHTTPRETIHKTSASLVVAQGAGTPPLVKRLNQQGKELGSFLAYDKKFQGGVHLAMGDVNGDGTEEIVTGPGKGGGPQVRVFDLNGKLQKQFFAFDTSDRHGIFVTTGDTNHDGVDEILVTQQEGGNGQVRIFNQRGEIQGAFYPFGRIAFPVHVAIGNMDEDAESEIVATLGGKDKSHRVRIFDVNGRYVREFKALPFIQTGLRVTTIHTRGEKTDAIVVGAEKGSSSWIGVYSSLGELRSTTLVYPQAYLGGVNLVAGNIDGNEREEIYTVPISKGGPHVRVFNAFMDPVGGFFPFPEKSRAGLSIAIWNP